MIHNNLTTQNYFVILKPFLIIQKLHLGGLSVPNDSVFKHFQEIEAILQSTLEKALLSSRVSQMLLSKVNIHEFKSPLHLCSTQLTEDIHLTYIRLRIFYTLKWRNREQTRPKVRKNRKLMKVHH